MLVREYHAMRQQKIKCRNTFIAEGADDFPVAETVIVPVHQVFKHAVRGIFNAVFFLQAGAAAQRDVAAALDGVSADVVILLDDNDGGPGFRGRNRRRKSRGPGADHHYVGGKIPMPVGLCGLRFLRADSAKRGRAQSGGCFLNKSSAR